MPDGDGKRPLRPPTGDDTAGPTADRRTSGPVSAPSRQSRPTHRPSSASSSSIPLPDNRRLDLRKALGAALGGILLVSVLAAMRARPAAVARPRERAVESTRTHARSLRATIAAVGPDATLGPDEVALVVNGLLCTLRWGQPGRPAVARGTPLILDGARLVSEAGRPPCVVAHEVHVATGLGGP